MTLATAHSVIVSASNLPSGSTKTSAILSVISGLPIKVRPPFLLLCRAHHPGQYIVVTISIIIVSRRHRHIIIIITIIIIIIINVGLALTVCSGPCSVNGHRWSVFLHAQRGH